ncbi:MAG: nitrilase family protein [Bacteroidota bacterium]|nr:nitrilase family protein [Bacteroidota bacterium]
MSALNIALIQSALHWEDSTANLAMFEEKIWGLKQPADLIVLPEMFNSGFTSNKEKLAETINGRTWKWMKQMAQQTGAAITGSFIIKVDGNYYNRLVWYQPDNQVYYYDKHYLFSYTGEDKLFVKGKERVIINWKGWNICPLICYDLRFPVWSRNAVVDNQYAYDLLLYVANWPASRDSAWQHLLHARAIENSCITIGVNIVGTDGRGLNYIGNSLICDPLSNDLAQGGDKETTIEYTLQKSTIDDYRLKFPFLKDEDILLK